MHLSFFKLLSLLLSFHSDNNSIIQLIGILNYHRFYFENTKLNKTLK